ncbi:MAG TPA: PilN domain-containing protein [Patescibacteria group bacterium]|nr:PilN domain-containing protein [Patescibacteria group bacterium]
MPNNDGINLLPEEGQGEERLRERKRLFTLASLGIVLVIGLLTIGSLAYSAYLKGSGETARNRITSVNKTLQGLGQIEVLYRTVHTKLVRLQGLLTGYPRNSIVLDDVASFTPAGVSLTSMTFDSTGKLALTGLASGAGAFGDFVNILKDPKTGGSKFSNVEIVSVSGGGKQGDYRFSLSMNRKAI